MHSLPNPPLSRCQYAAAWIAIVVIGLPTVMMTLIGGEAWPFLDYRMYAAAKPSPVVDWLTLVGRTKSGEAFALDHEPYIVPFALSELLQALEGLDIHGEVDATPARRALEGLLTAYEARRQAGEHNGPELVALDAYHVSWVAQTGAANYATPDTHTLLQSVRLPVVVNAPK